MSAPKAFGLVLLVLIGVGIYLDPRCNSTCKKVIRGIGTNLFG